MKEDVENRLRASIHCVRFIDLGVDVAPSATHLPWLFKDQDSPREYASIEEAFSAFDGRMLVLGGPGSGKTTTLLHIAQRLVAEAENDSAAPLPLIVNLSKFRLEQSARPLFYLKGRTQVENRQPDERVERWLIRELSEHPGVSSSTARKWVGEGRIAFLLDGLDEVDNEYRLDLVRVLNATLLRDHPDALVVVCSRIHEYQPLQDRKETRLQLRGAVTLQSLTNPQINRFLEEAQATGLAVALPDDAALSEMARTPLTLNMMVLAYGNARPADMSARLSLTDRRHILMEAYVAKMLQRKERRDRRIPFDECRDNDVPERHYAYSPEKVNKYLGWLALRLSVRMQTAFSLEQFWSFLTKEEDRDPNTAIWWGIRISRAQIVFLGAILAGLTVMPMNLAGFTGTLLIGIVGAVLSILAVRMFRSFDDSSGVTKVAQIIAASIAVICLVSGILVVATHGLSSVLPDGVPLIAMAPILVCLGLAFFLGLVSFFESDNRLLIRLQAVVTFVVFFSALILMRLLQDSEYAWYFLATSLVVIHAVFSFMEGEGSWKRAGSELAVVGGLVGGQLLGVWVIGDLEWHESLILAVSLAGFVFFIADCPNVKASLLIIMLFISFGLGSLVGGATGAAVGAIISTGMMIFLFATIIKGAETPRIKGLVTFAESLTGRTERLVEACLYSPGLVFAMSATLCLPLRFRRFSAYAEQALLLKRSAGDFEFVHRVLRDYFALRDLQPRLREEDSERRLEAIRSLGFQGESGLNALADYVRAENPEERRAAVWTLSKVASPKVVHYIEQALADNHPKVKRTAVLSVRNLPEKAGNRLFELIINDTDPSVQSAFVEVALRIAYKKFEGPITWFKDRADLRQIVAQFMGEHRDSKVRRAAAEALGHLGDRSAVTPLIEALTDSDSHVRGSAATALGYLADGSAVAPLIEALTDSDSHVRRSSAVALGHLGDRSAVGPLIEALADSDNSVRRSSATALGCLADGSAVAPLIKAFSDSDASVRDSAAEALFSLKDWEAVSALIEALSDSDASVRDSAARALKILGDASAVAPLIEALSDSDASVRDSAARALQILGDASAVAPLIEALSDSDSHVRGSAATALGYLGDANAVGPLTKALSDRDAFVRGNAADALGHFGDASAVAPLIKALSNRNASVRRSVVNALVRLRDGSAVPSLIKALSDSDDWVRRSSATALGCLADGSAVAPLIKAFSDSDASVRDSAAEALGYLGDASAVVPLVEALADTHDYVPRSAVRALHRLGDAKAVAPLIKALSDPKASVRGSAAEALGYLGDACAVASLIRALSDPDVSVRGSASEALGRLGDANAVAPLIKALSDPDVSVRGSASEALGRLGDTDAVAPLLKVLLDRDATVRASAAGALGCLGDANAVAPLIEALSDPDVSVRASAAGALGRSDDATVLAPLIEALSDRDFSVRVSAVRALGNLGDGRTVVPIAKMLADYGTGVRGSAARALGRLGDASALAPLIAALSDHDATVRHSITRAMGDLGDGSALAPFIKALSDSEDLVRRSASRALGTLGDASSVAPLIKALSYSDYEHGGGCFAVTVYIHFRELWAVSPVLRNFNNPEFLSGRPTVKALCSVVNALIRLRDRSTGPLLVKALSNHDAYVRSTAAKVLGGLGDTGAVAPLIDALSDSHYWVRRSAARGLGELGDASALAPLIEALSDSHYWVRRSAASALGRLGDASALTPLTEALLDSHSWVRCSAARALGGLCDVGAVGPLTEALSDVDASVRNSAAGALGHIGTPEARSALDNRKEA